MKDVADKTQVAISVGCLLLLCVTVLGQQPQNAALPSDPVSCFNVGVVEKQHANYRAAADAYKRKNVWKKPKAA